MKKRTDSLIFKIALIFFIFIFATLTVSGINTYVRQTEIYKAQCEENIHDIAVHLSNLIVADDDDFVWFQNYFLEHCQEMNVDIDFADSTPEREAFEKLFAEKYPGEIIGKTIAFDDLSDDVKMAYTKYKFEYYLLTFEQTRDDFNLIYVYYLVPDLTQDHYMTYMLDATREIKTIDGKDYIDLGITVPEVIERHQVMWEAWDTGTTPSGYDYYDNEYGKTYAYYVPVFVNGREIGVIGAEIAIERVNREILRNTFLQIAGTAAVLILFSVLAIYVINKLYISRIVRLESSIRNYTLEKDPSIASDIEKNIYGNNEISSLSEEIAAMILEIENYMQSLLSTTKELDSTKRRADIMHELANKDALTGIRNKNAYDNEIKHLEWSIAEGNAKFGIAMIDLNFLKRINDTYGHDKGNTAIKNLCYIICHIFEHSPVFRIGGDEFVVILQNDDLKNVDELVDKFNAKLDELAEKNDLPQWERVSASIGVAFFDPAIDNNAENVFKRADKAMYVRKKEMKAIRLS